MTRPVSQASVRHVTPADRDEWLRLRLAFWPEDGEAALARDVDRFLSGGHVATLHAAVLAVGRGAGPRGAASSPRTRSSPTS